MHCVTRKSKTIVLLCLAQFLVGCAGDRMHEMPTNLSSTPAKEASKSLIEQVALAEKRDRQMTNSGLQTTGAETALADSDVEDLFRGDRTLTPARLIQVMLERHPTLDQMRATAEAVQARYPQVVSLDDPMLNFVTAPGSIGSNSASYAARTELTQKIPFPGKRGLRGQIVQAEASAATQDVDATRLQLIESALNAFADFYLAEQAIVVNEDNRRFLQDFRQNAETRYKNGQATQQDVLQADVELARQQERTLSLERARQVAKARLNTLMHLPPESPLPPPDKKAPQTQTLEFMELRSMAIAARPELKALADRIAGEEASVQLALREYKPDVEIMGAYDSFWQGQGGPPLRWQVGAKINLPVRLARRDAAVAEAQARLVQRRAELKRQIDQINLQVQEAFEMIRESDKVIQLYEKKILPAAAANIKEAQSSYVNGKIPFVSLIEAQRSLIGLRDRYYEAISEAVRRVAALERAVGGAIVRAED